MLSMKSPRQKLKIISLSIFLVLSSLLFATQPQYAFPQAGIATCYGIVPDNISQDNMNKAIVSYYTNWVARYLLESTLVAGDYKVDYNATGATVSEAMGYGMLLTVIMAGADPQAKERFDGLNRFRKRYPSSIDSHLMEWRIPPDEISTNEDCATDGDIDIAMALLMASSQWNEQEYFNQATDIIFHIESSLVRTNDDNSLRLGDWNITDGETRLSDFITGFFDSFRVATGHAAWKDVENECYNIIDQLQSDYAPLTGLVPDFATNGTGISWSPSPPHFLEGPYDGDYEYNACRVPWRIGSAVVYHNDIRAGHIVNKIMEWVTNTFSAPIEFKAGYKLDGTLLPDHDYSTAAFIAPLGVAAMVSGNQQWLNYTFAYCTNSTEAYYEDSLNLLSMITMSGNAWVWKHHDFYVATNGNDMANGISTNTAWKTIQHALDMTYAGDTIYVRGGIYKERIYFPHSGSSSNKITLTNYPNELPVLDGAGFVVSNGIDALVELESVSDIEISGFGIRNLSTSNQWHVPVGVYLHGSSENITFHNLQIHNIENLYDNGGDAVSGADAHGLAVYGDQATGSIHNVEIKNVEIYNCKLGSSEALVLNGNVDGFSVSGCRVHDNNNIGIVFIGHEGVCADASLDQARNGICRNNVVYNINTIGNPAYRAGGSYDRSADGIYVDGGKQIIIERNTIHDCDICMEVASEHGGKSASFITVRNNLLVNGYTGGLFCGGYDKQRGSIYSCRFIGNTLYHNNTVKDYSGEITLQYFITNCVFRNNLLVALANDGGDAVFFSGPGGADSMPIQTSVDYNWYYSDESSSPSWRWGPGEYYNFSSWRTVGHDTNGTYGINPQLINPGQQDFHLQTNSPAANSGENVTDAGSEDLDGNVRIVEGQIDIGCYETQPVTSRGTPYAWLEKYQLITTNTYEAADISDVDNDQFMAWQEYIADTNPTNSADLFMILSITGGVSAVSIFFNSSTGRYYNLLWTSNIIDSLWLPWTGIAPWRGSGGMDRIDLVPTNNRSCFRISVGLNP